MPSAWMLVATMSKNSLGSVIMIHYIFFILCIFYSQTVFTFWTTLAYM
jgi:hypothetical protein